MGWGPFRLLPLSADVGAGVESVPKCPGSSAEGQQVLKP